jgi:hypothetical protein
MFSALAESTWGVPLVGALHVLCLALFAGTVLIDAPELRRFRWIGVACLVVTGVLLFATNPTRIGASWAFRSKMAMLVALLFVRNPRWLVLTLWAAVVAASRGIAYL